MDSNPQDADFARPDARPAGAESVEADAADESPAEAFRAAQNTLALLAEYIRHYVRARVDAMRVSVRNAVFYAALGLIGVVMLLTMVVTAVVMTCVGLGHAVSALLGHHVWLGELIIGVLLLGGTIGGAFLIKRGMDRKSKAKTAKKYASRRQQQRAQFGEDVGQSGSHAN